jgi:hypothetical protein
MQPPQWATAIKYWLSKLFEGLCNFLPDSNKLNVEGLKLNAGTRTKTKDRILLTDFTKRCFRK